ncbi:MAG: UPF0489 family protein [Calditrichaceae bacterium]
MSQSIYDFYNGFYIDQPVGNNAFSYGNRINKKIYVPPLIQGNIFNLAPGDKIVFSEIEDGVEKNKHGLQSYIHWMNNKVKSGSILVHVDQHTDMRQPNLSFKEKLDDKLTIYKIFRYTNYELNVGNFIQPAVETGLISSVEMINSTTAFNNPIPEQYILDIDMDIFAPELDFMDNQIKLAKIKSYIQKASFITIATSPFFIDQSRAIDYIKQLFE